MAAISFATIAAFAFKTAVATAVSYGIQALTQQRPKTRGSSSAQSFEQTLERQVANGVPLRILVGRRIVAGVGYYDNSYGADNKYAVSVSVLSAKPCSDFHQLYLDGEPVTLSGDPTVGEVNVTSHFLGKDDAVRAKCRLFLGDNNSGLGEYLSTKFPDAFSASDDFGDYCVIVCQFENTDDDFNTDTGENFIPFQGVPEVRVELSGAKVCDPRIGGSNYADENTYVYSDNAALIDAQFDYGFYSGVGSGRALIVGNGYPVDIMDLPQIISNANYCDAENYMCSGVLQSGQTSDQEEIWKCYNADRVEHSAKVYCIPEGNRTTASAIDLLEYPAAHVSYFDEHGFSTEVYNEGIVSYAEPDEYYAEVELDVYTNADWVAADNHIPRQIDLELLYVTDKTQGYRLLKEELYISRKPATCQIDDLPYEFIAYRVGDTVTISGCDIDYINGKTWIIKGRAQTVRGDVSFILREAAGIEAFGYDPIAEPVTPPVVTPPVRDWGTDAWIINLSYLTGFGSLAALNYVSLGNNLRAEDGSSVLGNSDLITLQGIASGITGQGAGATANFLSDLDLAAWVALISSDGYMFSNVALDKFEDGASVPVGWQSWSTISCSVETAANGRKFTRLTSDLGVQGGIRVRDDAMMPPIGQFKPGLYLCEFEATLVSGTFQGAGVYIYSRSSSFVTQDSVGLRISNLRDQDGELVGDGVVGKTYRFIEVVDLTAGDPDRYILHIMNNWHVFGAGMPAKTVDWTFCGMRPLHRQITGQSLFREDGVTPLINADILTALGIAAGITGQGPGATAADLAAFDANAADRLIQLRQSTNAVFMNDDFSEFSSPADNIPYGYVTTGSGTLSRGSGVEGGFFMENVNAGDDLRVYPGSSLRKVAPGNISPGRYRHLNIVRLVSGAMSGAGITLWFYKGGAIVHSHSLNFQNINDADTGAPIGAGVVGKEYVIESIFDLPIPAGGGNYDSVTSSHWNNISWFAPTAAKKLEWRLSRLEKLSPEDQRLLTVETGADVTGSNIAAGITGQGPGATAADLAAFDAAADALIAALRANETHTYPPSLSQYPVGFKPNWMNGAPDASGYGWSDAKWVKNSFGNLECVADGIYHWAVLSAATRRSTAKKYGCKITYRVVGNAQPASTWAMQLTARVLDDSYSYVSSGPTGSSKNIYTDGTENWKDAVIEWDGNGDDGFYRIGFYVANSLNGGKIEVSSITPYEIDKERAEYLATIEQYADVTGSNIASGFTGQGPWATYAYALQSLTTPNPNLAADPEGVAGLWTGTAFVTSIKDILRGRCWELSPSTGTRVKQTPYFPLIGGETYTLSYEGELPAGAGGSFYVDVICYNSSNTNVLDSSQVTTIAGNEFSDGRKRVTFTAPPSAVKAIMRIVDNHTGEYTGYIRRPKLERGPYETPWSYDSADVLAVQGALIVSLPAYVTKVGTGTMTTATVTGQVQNGDGAYTFAWTKQSGDAITVSNATAQSVQFGDGQAGESAVWRLTVTETSSSRTAYAETTVQFLSSL